ncbi:hypothetical protein C8R46DRAFT_1098621 [Mycena filopes]|nr:hypothetical protein C8R46DRAFT_1098597 [Mycena filopes]KAJ7164061.1 hypothetical protein C8R46DRAFT_1098621 [Mycena filopes]
MAYWGAQPSQIITALDINLRSVHPSASQINSTKFDWNRRGGGLTTLLNPSDIEIRLEGEGGSGARGVRREIDGPQKQVLRVEAKIGSKTWFKVTLASASSRCGACGSLPGLNGEPSSRTEEFAKRTAIRPISQDGINEGLRRTGKPQPHIVLYIIDDRNGTCGCAP